MEMRTFRLARPSGLENYTQSSLVSARKAPRREKYAQSGLEGRTDQRNMHTHRQKALTKLTAAALRSAHLDYIWPTVNSARYKFRRADFTF